MKCADENYKKYIQILKEELIPAQGCTEPIAIAYVAAIAARVLGKQPERMQIHASGNIIKNVKGVCIPGGGDLKGVEASAILGMLGGKAERKLEVLADLPEGTIEKARVLLRTNFCTVKLLKESANLHLIIEVWNGSSHVLVELAHTHTNIVRIERDGVIIYKPQDQYACSGGMTERACLNIEQIYAFADTCVLKDISDVIERQIQCNLHIAQEGMQGDWGLGIGKLLYLNGRGRCCAYAAAASDARMSGCELPVVIVSGSGNQGATASLPVIAYAEEHEVTHEKLIRALVLSNLIAIHQKTGIGRLSAYCGAVSAAVGSASAITYLKGGSLKQIEDTITNTIANISGIVCDGAKPSCAAKIASAVEAGILGHELAMRGKVFEPNTGIVKSDVEKTIAVIGRIARDGMKSTDMEILQCMISNDI